MPETNRLIGIVGDVLVDRDNPDTAFDLVRDVLAVPDFVAGNCECAYAADPVKSPGVTVPVVAHPRNIPSMARAGFDLMTLANNHALDAGHQGLYEMQSHFEAAGMLHCGAGRNLVDARKPAIAKLGDMTVATLSYATFFPRGYEALDDWPGLAPIRAFTHCRDKLPNVWSPGTPPVITTIPHQPDIDNLREDIRQAREVADIVIVHLHGGDYHRPFVLSDFELLTARSAIDFGAHGVAAHHHHILRGVEWYKDAPIFYGLGHFVFDLHSFRGPKELVPDRAPVDPETDETYDLAPRQGWPLLPWHRDARMTMIALMQTDGSRITAAGFLPCMINREGQSYPVSADSPEGAQVVRYVEQGCNVAGLGTRLQMTDRFGLNGFTCAEMVQ